MKPLALGIGVAAVAAALIRKLRGHRGDSEGVVRSYFDAWSEGDGDKIRELVTDDFQAHVQTLGDREERGADELITAVESHSKAFSELEYELHDVISHNGCVAVRATMHAHHEETGREGEMEGIAFLRLDGDRIAEEWASWDYLGLVDQLGLKEGE
jgi:ketosteroid isomerase-like protein